jgi:hypothetical protein
MNRAELPPDVLTLAGVRAPADAAEEQPTPPLRPAALAPDRLLATAEIERALGQTVQAALDLRGWDQGGGLENLLTRVHDSVTASVREEGRLRREIRRHVLSALPDFPDAPAQAGVYAVSERHLRDAYRNVLLRGGLTAADGACTGHDGLAATLVSIGVSLARYDGNLNSWRTTFARHDYRVACGDTVEELRGLLDRRARRSGSGPGSGRDHLTSLLRRGFMLAAERKALLERTASRWRLGHGPPAPLELLTGSGSMALIDETLPVLDDLLLKETRWVFIPSTLSNRALTTLANALDPGQLAVFQKGKASLEDMVERGTYEAGYRRRVQAFAARAGEALVIGGFRATRYAPGQLFVAHADRALEAGVIALADAALQPHRGFPLLLDLAGLSAKAGLAVEAFQGVVESAYARAGASGLFAPERILRDL